MCVNRIEEVLKNKGLADVRPTDKQLKDMGISIHTWNKWYRKNGDPALSQLEDIAIFLECSIDELIERQETAA